MKKYKRNDWGSKCRRFKDTLSYNKDGLILSILVGAATLLSMLWIVLVLEYRG